MPCCRSCDSEGFADILSIAFELICRRSDYLSVEKYVEACSENPDDSSGSDVHRAGRNLARYKSNWSRSDEQPRIPIHDKNHEAGDHYGLCLVCFRLWAFFCQCQSSERTHCRGHPHRSVSLVRAHYVGLCQCSQLDRCFPAFWGAHLRRRTHFLASRSFEVCCPSSAHQTNCWIILASPPGIQNRKRPL